MDKVVLPASASHSDGLPEPTYGLKFVAQREHRDKRDVLGKEKDANDATHVVRRQPLSLQVLHRFLLGFFKHHSLHRIGRGTHKPSNQVLLSTRY